MARPKEFDLDVVLDRAIELFWEQGYEATSIESLVERMGIKRQSLYNAFGDKHSLFLRVLERYHQVIVLKNLQFLNNSGSPMQGIHDFFEEKIEHVLNAGKLRSCLITNSATELALFDTDVEKRVSMSLGEMENALFKALVRAHEAGEITRPLKDLRALAGFLLNSTQGLLVIGRTRTDRQELQDIVDLILSVLK